MNDNLDIQPYDLVALAEIEMITNLMIAAGATDKPLSSHHIDQALS